MAYQLGGALAGLYDPDDLEPLVTPYQKLRLGLEPPRSSPFYDVESELARRAAPVLHRNLAQDGDDGQGTRAVTYELIDQLLRARNARTINQPDARDKLRTTEQVSEASRGPSFTEKAAFDYLPRTVEFVGEMMKPQSFHEQMTNAERTWNEGNYGASAAHLGLAPFGALADVAGTVLLPGAIEKSIAAKAAKPLSQMSAWAGKAADESLGGSRMAAGAGLAAGGAAMLPSDAEAGAPKWYSPLRKMIEDAPQSKATLDQWMGYLTNRPGVKKEELEYTFGSKAKDANLLENLAGESQPITKRELLRHFDENDVPVEEVFYSGDKVKYGGTDMNHGGEYSLPGDATDYREIAVTSPRAEWDPNISEGHFGSGGHMRPEPDWQDKKAGQQIGWIRGDVRELDDGSRAFHVDEFQSDPAQRALKKGWKSPDDKARWDELEGRINKIQEELSAAADPAYTLGWHNRVSADPTHPMHEKTLEYRQLAAEQGKIQDRMERGVPDRPWKKDWPKLLFRRALWEAVQEDADHLTWTPADIQQKRWGKAQLGRDRLYEETIPKIAAEEAKRLGLPKEAVGEAEIKGSKWTEEAFMDSINPDDSPGDIANQAYDFFKIQGVDTDKYVSRLAEIGELSDSYEAADSALRLAAKILKTEPNGNTRLYSLKLTPEVRKRILADGLPKFVGAGVAPSLLDRFLSEEP